MTLRTFKSKKDNLFYFEIRSKKLGRVFLKNTIGFKTKVQRNDFLIAVVNSLSETSLTTLKKAKNNQSFLVLKNKFGKTLLRSKRFNQDDFISLQKELKENIEDLKIDSSNKPSSNHLKLNLDKNQSFVNTEKKDILKKERKPKAEKVYLKKGTYHFNDITYDIFLSGNGKHYFSFINKDGKTVLLNGNIKGFESVEEAEKLIAEVMKFAPNKSNFETKTAKDGKFFFNLYNDKKEKIAKSFFFRKIDELEKSVNEFVGTVPLSSNPTTTITPSIISKQDTFSEKNKIEEEKRKKIEAEERKLAAEKERRSLERKREEERILAAKEKERKAIAIAAEKKSKENERVAAVNQTRNTSYNDKDPFDGCFKWIGILMLLGLIILILSFFKGCFGNFDKNAFDNTKADQKENADTLIQDQINTSDTLSINENGGSQVENTNAESNKAENNINNNDGNGSKSSIYTTSDNSSSPSAPKCNCEEKAIVFKIPNTEAKSVSRLGTNPQFGNTHGLNSADFLEELKYASQTNDWDKKYLNYLYKAMGYKNGFSDAKVSQISQQTITPGINGILGFGKYSGYGYSKLDLKGKDLEVFRIEAENGCHINFMKTCGNLLFVCN